LQLIIVWVSSWCMGTKFLTSLLTWLDKNGGPFYGNLSLKKCLSHPRQKLEVRSKLTEAITAIFHLTMSARCQSCWNVMFCCVKSNVEAVWWYFTSELHDRYTYNTACLWYRHTRIYMTHWTAWWN